MVFIFVGFQIDKPIVSYIGIFATVITFYVRHIAIHKSVKKSIQISGITFIGIYMSVPFIFAPLFSPLLGLTAIWFTTLLIFETKKTRLFYSILLPLCIIAYSVVIMNMHVDYTPSLMISEMVLLLGVIIYIYLSLNIYYKESKKFEEAQINSQTYLSRIFNASDNFVYTKDADLKYSLVNDRFAELLQLPKEDIIGKTSQELGITFPFDNVEEDISIINKNKTLRVDRLRIDHGINGSSLWVNYLKIAIKRPKEDIREMLCIINDISDQIKSHKQTLKLESRYRDIFERSFDSIFVINKVGEIMEANASANRLLELGNDPKDLFKRNINEFFVDSALIHLDDILKHLEQTGIYAFPHAKWITAKGNERIVDVVASPQFNDDDNIIGFYIRALDITQQEKAKHSLKQVSDQFETLFEKTPIGIAIRNVESNKFINVNSNLANMLGYSKEELYQLDRSVFTHPEDEKDLEEKTQKLLNGEIGYFQSEKRYIRKDGSIFWVSIYRTVFDIDDKPHLIGISENIHQEKLFQQALQLSEEQHRSFIEASPDVTLVMKLDGTITYISPNGVKLFGYESDERFIGEYFEKFLADANYDRFKKEVRLIIDEGEPQQYNYVGRKEDGQVFNLEIFGNVLYNENSKPIAVIGILRDVTQRIKAQQALTQSENKYRSLVETSPDGIVVADMMGTLTFASPQALKLFGYENQEEVLGRKIHNFVTKKDSLKFLADLEKLRINKTRERYNYTGLRKDGTTFYIETYGNPLLNANGEIYGVMGVIRDITEEHNQRQKLIESEKRYRTLFEGSSQGILILNCSYEIIHGNKSSISYLDLNDAKELTQRTFDEFFPVVKEQDIIEKIMHTDQKEITLSTQEGKDASGRVIYAQMTISQRAIDSDRYFICLIQDVTESFNLEKSEKELEIQKTINSSLQRELTSNSLIRSQKNRILTEVKDDIEFLIKKNVNGTFKPQLQKIQRKIDRNLNEKEDWLSFKLQFEKVHPYFLQNLLNDHPSLSVNDLKHSAYIKLHMSPGDVSNLLFIEKKSVDMTRYRLKKKLGLKKEDSLYEYLNSVEAN